MSRLLNYPDIKFLYLRTKYDNVTLAGSVIQELNDAIHSGHTHRRVRLLEHRRNAVAWNNGFVLALSSSESVAELADILRPGLDGFGSWALLDYRGECVEPYGEGPVGVFIKQAQASGFCGRPSQVFLMFRSRERDHEGITDAVRGQLGPDTCRTVFHFDDGRVLLCASQEPARLLVRRAETALSRLYTWSILDSSGESLFRDESGDWRFVDQWGLEFTD